MKQILNAPVSLCQDLTSNKISIVFICLLWDM